MAQATPAPQSVSASITAQNTFTDPMNIGAGGSVSLSISGTFVATVTIQHRLNGEDWRDVATYTGEVEKIYDAGERADVRVGVKTGDFTSGTAVLRLGIG